MIPHDWGQRNGWKPQSRRVPQRLESRVKKLIFPFRELIEAGPPEVGGRAAVPEKARETTRGWGH